MTFLGKNWNAIFSTADMAPRGAHLPKVGLNPCFPWQGGRLRAQTRRGPSYFGHTSLNNGERYLHPA
jgi:hypothetical protein